MKTTLERELKLDAAAGFELPALPGEPLADRVFTSTYYDTPSRSLGLAGITLRRRVENRKSLWQLKLPRAGARAEIEASGGPSGPPRELASLLVAHLRRGALEPVASLRTRRGGVHVVEGRRSVAEVTVDDVDILDGRRRVGGFTELEIELLDGGEDADLERLGRELRRAGARRSDGRAKVRRVVPVEARAAPRKGARLRDVLAYQLRRQLDQLEARDPGVRLGGEPEDVHRFRVATRRSRALIRATRARAGERLVAAANDLGWLAGLLGEVRDLDVLLARLEPLVAALDADAAGGESILELLRGEREAKRADLLSALDSERYLSLLDRIAEAVETIPDTLDGDPRAPARAELERLERAAAKVTTSSADDELHALRIRAKRARYTAELAALTGGKRLARYVEAVTAVQDVIGEHQDAVVAEERLRAIATPASSLAAGRLIELERRRRSDARARCAETVAAALAAGRAALR
jgi:CHAD domain-containing protein